MSAGETSSERAAEVVEADARLAALVAARTYAAAVRARLADLPADVVEELTGGLAADLADVAAESATPLPTRLGPPDRYAAELRAAAGLPAGAEPAGAEPAGAEPAGAEPTGAEPAGAEPGAPSGASAAAPEPGPTREPAGEPARDPVPPLGDRLAAAWARQRSRSVDPALARLRARPWWPYVRDLGRTLRPAWWLVRAWVAFELLLHPLARGVVPGSLGGLLALLALAWVSVELGRGRWAVRGRWVRALLAGNAVAAVALAPLAWSVGSPGVQYVTSTSVTDSSTADTTGSSSADATSTKGLQMDGEPVANLFPYDSSGHPLTGVQLLDDRGRPVVVGSSVRAQWESDGAHPFAASVDADGRVRWNAYPLRASSTTDGDGAATTVPLPVATLPALLQPSATATSTAGTTDAPSAAGSAAASPTATATASTPAPTTTASTATAPTSAPTSVPTPAPTTTAAG